MALFSPLLKIADMYAFKLSFAVIHGLKKCQGEKPTDWLQALSYSSASPSCEQQPCSILSREHEIEDIAA